MPGKEPDPAQHGLKHNPFASLRARAEAAGIALPEARAAEPPSVAQPAPAPVRERVTVRLERSGRGGKTVTLAEGPGLAGRPLEELARALARALGTGARVEEGALVVQGDQRERLAEWLLRNGFDSVARAN